MQNVHRSIAGTKLGQSVSHSFARDPGRLSHSLFQGQSPGQARCKRGRMRTARSMRRGDVVPVDRDLDVALPVEEMIDRRVPVTPGDNDGGRASIVNPLGELAARARPAGQSLRLEEVRRHDGRKRKKTGNECLDRIVSEEPRTGAGDHHRVDHEWQVPGRECVRNRLDHLTREEHAGLRRIGSEIAEHGVQLCANERGRNFVHGDDARRVLSRQRDDRAHAVAARSSEGLQIGLDPCPAARVRAGDRQTPWNQNSLPSPVLTGSGSTGVISAPKGTPVTPGYHRQMAVGAALWDELLEGEEVAHVETVPAADPRVVALPEALEPKLREALPFNELYVHQRDAFDAAARGEHVILATGTASGKSLGFNLPVLDAIARDPKNRALYLYPTKALSQDQARALAELKAPNVRAAIYDGDTPGERRWQIRKWANIVLTNPDMLHVGVLPHHDRWADVLHNLRYIVVDEAHVYRGVFGSHVGNVLRRLRRLAQVYGADPQFLLASATIANPGQLAARLAGVDATVVDTDAAPRAERTILLWNPELLDPELGLRASALGDASKLMAELVSRGLRTICFAKSRKAAELIHKFTVERVDSATGERLAPYRAGYTPAQRRDIERRLVEGELLGVSATDALELGIDIGLLDCAISVGFPGTVSSLRQQWGRAGRRGHGLAVLVASEDALDQYFVREPETLLQRSVEAAILDHANPRVLDGHVRAAAFEAPLDDGDRATLGDEALERAALLPDLKHTKTGYVWAGREYPAAQFGLRSTTPDTFAVVEAQSGTVLGIVERERAHSTVHEGAIYLHLGESYLVRELDLQTRTAVVTPYKGDYYTQAKKDTNTAIEETLRVERRCGLDLHFGRISVTERVVAYQKKSIRDQSTLETVELDLPETSFETEAIWYLPEPEQLDGLEKMPKLLGTLHAAEHAMIALLPLWAMCDRWDIGGLSTNIHFQTDRPTVFIYDGHSGGVGITERGFNAFEGWVEDTARMLEGCPCSDGCPSCVQSPKCGNLNEMLDKAGARTLLRRMVAASVASISP